MAAIAEANSLFEIDAELDNLLEAIEEQAASEGQPSEDLVARFQQFCEAYGDKVDRIGRFLRMMEAREQFCRSEAARLSNLAFWLLELTNICADCALHEQIVILFPPCEVLSKEQGSRLNE